MLARHQRGTIAIMSLGGPPEVAASILQASELAALRRDWGHCYEISFDRPWWCARRRDTGARIRSGTPISLRDAIKENHAVQPVLKRFRIPEAS